MSSRLVPLRVRRLLDVGRLLVAELDPGVVLDRILAAAREATGARYAAIGILDERQTELEQFLTLGLDEQTRQAIGELPHGRGVLGILISEPRPLRRADVSEHPASYGFPAGHPVMRGFLDDGETMPAGLQKAFHGSFFASLPGDNAAWVLLGLVEALVVVLLAVSLLRGSSCPSVASRCSWPGSASPCWPSG